MFNLSNLLIKASAQDDSSYIIPGIGEKYLPTDLTTLLDDITLFAQKLAIPVAIALYLLSAFLYLTSAGEAEKIKRANQAVLYTTVGLIVVLIAHGLALVVRNIFAPDLPIPDIISL
jgi:formate-dependent nitrite reductase membrane component NrfD